MNYFFMSLKRIKLNLEKITDLEMGIVVDYLKRSKVVVLPTDTVYGLSALASDQKAVRKIYALKRRESKKPLVILMKSFCMLREYCNLNRKQYLYLKEGLKEARPLTVILKNKDGKLKHLANEKGGLAVRIPRGSDFLIKLLKKINQPIVSTSLNISGQKEIENLENIEKIFDLKDDDLILDGGELKNEKTSRIEDISDMKNIKVIRE
jgi:L-threonylcarbamoyladenylate synthase